MADPKWGVLGRDGKWNGLMEAVVEKRFDMALTSLKVNADREAAIDFTAPFLESGWVRDLLKCSLFVGIGYIKSRIHRSTILVAKRTGIISPTAYLGKG